MGKLQAPDYTFRFGKYKGEHISDVPSDYLEWVLETFEDEPRNDRVLDCAESELAVRERSDAHFYTERS
uniref:Putative quorum-sensing-regulated virulence factor n=1 Tax=viral metagenome TaxID=1070528 RepID=A0A6M3LQE6_9ZZZZ